MNIVLIGMRGSGKTTIGNFIAKKLDWQFIETDSLIEKNIGTKISKFVNQSGWIAFRTVESKFIDNVSNLDSVVISSGGGVVIKKENIRKLKKNGVLIWLTASNDTLYNRIKDDRNRPFLTNARSRKEEIKKVFKVREKLYKGAADLVVSTETNTIEQALHDIYKYLNSKNII